MSAPNATAEQIFAAALELTDATERRDYLERTCARDPGLRRDVESLLAAHEQSEKFLEQPPTAVMAAGVRVPPSGSAVPDPSQTETVNTLAEQAGERIGRYKLLEKIGEGGFGDVWMAEQEEPVRRRVALKIIKLGMDTREVVARFEAERQALALMEHPNIAKVFDGGATDTGRPYFVMELVRGVPITAYCDSHRLTVRERLELFTKVCQAVQHAHQKGIIHRDVKPSNVLVTVQEDRPVPKVIDFGIAKATAQRLTEKTLFTRFHQFVGTPAYMSPEQTGANREDIDTRTDVYSLGVLLYELLTGKTPFNTVKLLEAGYEAILKTICEEEPPKPSTRLTSLTKEELGMVAAGRGTAPEKLGKLVRGELDWIVMKCLEKDRHRRYESASAFAGDLEHYLNNEPVAAAAPGAVYRARKFIRRHRTALAIGTAMSGLLLLGLLATSWQAVAAKRAERKSQQVARFLQDMLGGIQPEVARGRDTRLLLEILDETAVRIGRELKSQPEVEGELRMAIARAYRASGSHKKAEAMAREAVLAYRKAFGPEHEKVAEALTAIAVLLYDGRKFGEAEGIHRQALAMKRKFLGQEHAQVAQSLNALAIVLSEQGKAAEAEELFREALRVFRKLFGPEHRDVAMTLDNLGCVLHVRGKLAESQDLHSQALALRKRLLGPAHLAVADSLDNLAAVMCERGRLSEAEPLLRESLALRSKLLGPDHPQTANSFTNLAKCLGDQGRRVEAGVLLLYRADPRESALNTNFSPVVATVNGKLIRESDVQRAMSETEQTLRNQFLPRQPEQFQRRRGELMTNTIQDLINHELILEEFAGRGLEVSPQALEEHIAEHIKDDFQGDINLMFLRLAQSGTTFQEFREREREKIVVTAMREEKLKDIQDPSAATIERYYHTHETNFSIPEAVDLSVIIIPLNPTNRQATTKAQRNLAAEIRERVASGVDFASEARLYSQDRTARTGGHWGWMERKRLREELQEVAFSLKPGQVSEVIEAGSNLFLLLVRGHRPDALKPLTEVQDQIRETILKEERRAILRGWISSLRSNAVISEQSQTSGKSPK